MNALRRLVHQREGALTKELEREESPFGLGQVPVRLAPDRTVASICGYCSTGCSLDVHVKSGQAVNLSPSASYPVNLGMACPKGWEALTPLTATDRATTPLLRDARGRLQPVDWETALAAFVGKFKAIQDRHGSEAVAFLSTGQIPTEEMALLGALAKFGMGIRHGDGNTRQCMASAVVAYKQAFGFDAPPYTYADLEESDVIVLVGSNLCVAHPILWQRVSHNPHSPEIIVVDPRTTETAVAATQHYALSPKSDLPLLYGLAGLLIERGWVDKEFIAAHTSGFDDFAAHVARFTPEVVEAATGLGQAELERFAETVHNGSRVSWWWTMGVNQSHEGVRTAQAIINLALITGSIGRPGTGANSITGQCNAMGSRLFSNTTSLLGGHDFADERHRVKVASALNIDVGLIPTEPSLAYDQIMESILARRIRGLWVIATNTAHSWINQSFAHDVLGRLDFLVVQDMYTTTETAERSHLVLPAAGWGEKDGTFINSERRIGVVQKVADPPGMARSDFEIFKLIAEAWGCGPMFDSWRSPADTFEILKGLSAGQPCDMTGISGYEMIRARGGIQWPYRASAETESDTDGNDATERRLFADGRFFHPDGRARVLFDDPRPVREPTSQAYPLVLLTGRGSASQWHTETRTGKSAVLRSLAPTQVYVDISPTDASDRGIEPQDWVDVRSRRGSVRARAFVTATVAPGQLFMAMHHRDVNRLTDPSFDPYSRQPAYKSSAVDVRLAST